MAINRYIVPLDIQPVPEEPPTVFIIIDDDEDDKAEEISDDEQEREEERLQAAKKEFDDMMASSKELAEFFLCDQIRLKKPSKLFLRMMKRHTPKCLQRRPCYWFKPWRK